MDSETLDRDGVWACTEPMKTLADLNDQCLELLIDQAMLRAQAAPTLLRDLLDLWCSLDVNSRRRAAACPFLLVDAGFADPYRWRWVGGHRIGDREPAALAPFFSVPRLPRVAHQVFAHAWYIARTQPIGASLYLGIPPTCVSLFRSCSMRQITELADQHPGWLRPRWAGRVEFWRDLLEAAIANEGLALERARLQGVLWLGAELRTLEHPSISERR